MFSDIVVTTAGDLTVKLWDLQRQSEQLSISGHTDTIQSVTWNYNASVMATSCKDTNLRIIDPRAKNIIQVEL